jgi:small conductance mechanosensitive channel
MEQLSSYLGFEARYIVFPIIVLLVGAATKIIVHPYMKRWADKTVNQLDNKVVAYLDSLVTPLVLLTLLYGFSHWLPLPAKRLLNLQKGLLILIVLVVAYFTTRLVSSVIAFAASSREGWQRFLQPFQTLSKVILVLIAAALSFKILDVNMSDEGIRIIRIVGIVAGSFVVLRIIKLAVAQVEHFVRQKDGAAIEAQKRAQTLGKIINSAAAVVVVSVSVMMILSEFSMNIMPIITGAGIAGLAIGFGAQNLVRDVISGFFIILEDQIRVGDAATINGVSGNVEAIKLRTTILRDFNGTVHIFPNGEIKQVANHTKEYSYYAIDVGVAYKENVDEVMDLLRETGSELLEDPQFAKLILSPLEVLGVDSFGNSQVTIKMRIKTQPQQQWVVGRELRRRIKNAFDSHKIEMPFPHMSVYFGEASKPFEINLHDNVENGGPKKVRG